MEQVERIELEYYRFEEATDIAERLGYPIDHVITQYIVGGEIFDNKMVRIADYTAESLAVAPMLFTGDAAFEIERRESEHATVLGNEVLVSGRLNGNAKIKYSPAPRQVLESKSSIKGYRPDLRRDLMSIFYIENDKLQLRIISLDSVNDETRYAVGKYIGIDMSPDRGDREVMDSEVVAYIDKTAVDEIVEMVKLIHDDKLREQTGNITYAGSRFLNKGDALSIVRSNKDLLDQHMAAWSGIVGSSRGRNQQDPRMEHWRVLTTSAIDLRLKGESIGSISDGGVADNAATGNFDPSCPTGMNSGSNMLDSIGMSQGKKEFISKTCPMCGDTNVVTRISGSVISGACGCARDICTGETISINRHKNTNEASRDHDHLRANKVGKVIKSNEIDEQVLLTEDHGEYAELRNILVVGGVKKVIVDRRTGTELAA